MQHINCFQRILLYFQLLTQKTVLDSYKQMVIFLLCSIPNMHSKTASRQKLWCTEKCTAGCVPRAVYLLEKWYNFHHVRL